MRFYIVCLCLFLSSCSLGQDCKNQSFPNGLEVIYDDIDRHIPSGWDVNKKAEHDFYSASGIRMTASVVKEYDKYPASIRDVLNLKLVWFSQLRISKVDYYCTYNTRPETIYLKSITHAPFYTRQMFHHELSSILLKKHADQNFEVKFTEHNPEDFKYFDESGRGRNAITTNKDSEDFETEINEKGFLNEYGMSHWENDFNEIAQNLFLPKAGFWKLYDTHGKLKKKVDIVIALYTKIDASLTLDYFKSLNK